MTLRLTVVLALIACLAGCGEAARPAPPKVVKPAVTTQPASATQAETKKEETRTATARPAPDKAKVAAMFKVPEISRPATAQGYGDAAASGTSALPAIRFLGFTRRDGVLAGLVEVRGEVLAICQGDVIEGAEVVAVDTDSVSFQYQGKRWSCRLFARPEKPPVVLTKAADTNRAPAETTEPKHAAIDFTPPTSPLPSAAVN